MFRVVVSSASQGQRFRVPYALGVPNKGDHCKNEEALGKLKKKARSQNCVAKKHLPGKYKFEALKEN